MNESNDFLMFKKLEVISLISAMINVMLHVKLSLLSLESTYYLPLYVIQLPSFAC